MVTRADGSFRGFCVEWKKGVNNLARAHAAQQLHRRHAASKDEAAERYSDNIDCAHGVVADLDVWREKATYRLATREG
jgi:hypothetical protein